MVCIVPTPVILPTKISAPFPQITQPFVAEGTAIINQAWLQLLIAMWNRTGEAPGVDSTEILMFSTMNESSSDSALAQHNAELGLLVQDLVQKEIQRLGLDSAPSGARDPLEALLFMDATSGDSSEEESCGACVVVEDLAAGGVISLTDYSCGTLFTNGT